MLEYYNVNNNFCLWKLLRHLQFQDCALMGEKEPGFSYLQNGVPCSRIDAVYVNTAVCKLIKRKQGI